MRPRQLQPGMAVLARQQVVTLGILHPPVLVGSHLRTCVGQAAQQQVLGLRQPRHPAAVLLAHGLVRLLR
ncbi:hypothetical protein D3C80_2052880 [compost metagenome]